MDRGACRATVHGIERVRSNSATKPQPLRTRVWKFLKKTKNRATRWPNPNPRIAQQLKYQAAQRKPTPHSLFHSLLVTRATFNIYSMFQFCNPISLHGFPPQCDPSALTFGTIFSWLFLNHSLGFFFCKLFWFALHGPFNLPLDPLHAPLFQSSSPAPYLPPRYQTYSCPAPQTFQEGLRKPNRTVF